MLNYAFINFHKPQWAGLINHSGLCLIFIHHSCWMAINLHLVLLNHPHIIDTYLIKLKWYI